MTRLDPARLRVYFVTDPELCAARGVVETAVAAARGGATLVQLRDPHATSAHLLATARALVAALSPLDVPVIVNDRPDIARLSGAAGVHVGQRDLTPTDVRTLLGETAVVGLSIEQATQLDRVDWDAVDYIGAGPVFGVGVKHDAAPPFGLEGLRAVTASSRAPVVAIGGVGAAQVRVRDCLAAGVAGIAVVSAIAAAPDPEAAARHLRSLLEARP
ncbi:MAG: thiamine phosphate synthase [Bradymonadia bacterium]